MEILVVEDDTRMAALLERGLSSEGHVVHLATTGVEGLEYARTQRYDIILMDIMLPLMNGMEVVVRLREEQNPVPVLMLTARDAPHDAATGLDTGADDYLTKPFAFDELLARIRAVVRRGPVSRPVELHVGELRLNPAARKAWKCDREIQLTRREFQLLELLMRRNGQVVSRDVILDSVWGNSSDVELNTVDAFVSALRRKLADHQQPRLIETVRGIGFRLNESGS